MPEAMAGLRARRFAARGGPTDAYRPQQTPGLETRLTRRIPESHMPSGAIAPPCRSRELAARFGAQLAAP